MFNQEKEVKDKAWTEGGWTEAGILIRNRRPDSALYKCKEYVSEILGRPCRLIVVHSSKLDKRRADGLFYSVSGDVEAEEVIVKRERPGRPRRDEATPTKTVYKAKAQVAP